MFPGFPTENANKENIPRDVIYSFLRHAITVDKQSRQYLGDKQILYVPLLPEGCKVRIFMGKESCFFTLAKRNYIYHIKMLPKGCKVRIQKVAILPSQKGNTFTISRCC